MIEFRAVTFRRFKTMEDYLDYIAHLKRGEEFPEPIVRDLATKGKAWFSSQDGRNGDVESVTQLRAVEIPDDSEPLKRELK